MKEWFTVKEQGAGKFRLLFLWYLYRLCGLACLKFFLRIVVFFIAIFAKPARGAHAQFIRILQDYRKKHGISPTKLSFYRHVLEYAWSLADKMSVLCDNNPPLKVVINEDDAWHEFLGMINQNTGVFMLCSHLGNIETLSLVQKQQNNNPQKKLHALMQISQTGIFYNFIKNRVAESLYELHPAEDMDMGTIMALYEYLEKGDLVMMAADRVSAQNPENRIDTVLLDKKCHLPKGVFSFAVKMKHPVFAVFLLKTKSDEYMAYFHKMLSVSNADEMAKEYITILEKHLLKNPQMWFNFYNFFDE